jgi:hypothetical protein
VKNIKDIKKYRYEQKFYELLYLEESLLLILLRMVKKNNTSFINLSSKEVEYNAKTKYLFLINFDKFLLILSF